MLAGIQFVPKEKRAAVEDEREKKKARKDKKAHKREKERRRDARSDSDDDDAGGMLDADEMRRLAEAPASAPPPDLLSKASASASSSAPAPPPAPVQVTAAAAPSAPAAAPAAAPPISSNKEMAALLRARLKAPGILPAAPAPAPASASGSAPATQHQHQQQHQQQQPSNALAPDKRFLMAAKLSEKASGQALSALSAAQRLRVEARLEENMDEVYASNILRMGERYVGGELGGGGKHLARGGEDEEEGDVDVSMFTRQASEGAQQRQLAQQEQAARRAQQAQARCDLCAGSASHRAQLVVHTGALVALRLLPPHQQLVPLHCEIFPCAHFPSMLQAGAAEDGLEAEVAALKACLVKVFESLGQAVVFCEAAVGFSRGPHARVAVVPVPRGSQGEAQMMFREAMQDMNGHFAQNAKIVDLTHARPLSRAIPPHFPYLHAETAPPAHTSASSSVSADPGARTGMAHVVDVEEDADSRGKGVTSSYLLDVVAGLLDEEPLGMRRKPGPGFREDVGATARGVEEMRRLFERHFY